MSAAHAGHITTNGAHTMPQTQQEWQSFAAETAKKAQHLAEKVEDNDALQKPQECPQHLFFIEFFGYNRGEMIML